MALGNDTGRIFVAGNFVSRDLPLLSLNHLGCNNGWEEEKAEKGCNKKSVDRGWFRIVWHLDLLLWFVRLSINGLFAQFRRYTKNNARKIT